MNWAAVIYQVQHWPRPSRGLTSYNPTYKHKHISQAPAWPHMTRPTNTSISAEPLPDLTRPDLKTQAHQPSPCLTSHDPTYKHKHNSQAPAWPHMTRPINTSTPAKPQPDRTWPNLQTQAQQPSHSPTLPYLTYKHKNCINHSRAPAWPHTTLQIQDDNCRLTSTVNVLIRTQLSHTLSIHQLTHERKNAVLPIWWLSDSSTRNTIKQYYKMRCSVRNLNKWNVETYLWLFTKSWVTTTASNMDVSTLAMMLCRREITASSATRWLTATSPSAVTAVTRKSMTVDLNVA